MPAHSPCRSILGIRASALAALVALTLLPSIALAQKPMCHAMGTRDETPPDKLPAPKN